MTIAFLHGAETIEVVRGSRPIRGVKTAVIGLVGTAPTWAVDAADRTLNTPRLVLSEQDAAKYFGSALDGYTIPQALQAIFDQGRGIVVVVNVFDPSIHTGAVALASYVVDDAGRAALPDRGVSVVVVKNQAADTTYAEGVDYTVDALNGAVLRKVGGAIAIGDTIKVSYHKPDPSAVTAADVIGAVSETGARSGLLALDDTYSLLGFNPKLLIAPGYSTDAGVVAALSARATRLRAIALVDAPADTTVADAIAGRGPEGTINFETSSDRVVLCYPQLLVSDGDGGTVLEPYSQRLAGVIAARDSALGYHWSPSNAEIIGIVGLERRLTAGINDPSSEVNALNEVGIVTVFNAFGTGFRTWGNRSAAWPATTSPVNLINIRRTADILHESIELAMLQFIDQPISDALVDAITESVNGFIRTLIGRGALVDGSCSYDPADNAPEEVALGHLTFGLDFMPPPPAERISVKSFIDVTLLGTIGAQQS